MKIPEYDLSWQNNCTAFHIDGMIGAKHTFTNSNMFLMYREGQVYINNSWVNIHDLIQSLKRVKE